MTRSPRVRTLTPAIFARILEVKHETVLAWIHSGDLPAMNIGTRGAAKRFIIFRKDAIAFMRHRGLPLDRVAEVLPH